MGVISKAGSDFKPCPQGLHQAVCVDVVDKGLVKATYNGHTKEVHRVQVRWQVEELNADGRPYMVMATYTNSLHKKSRLRPDLEAWRGRPFSEEELKGFDLDNLIGVNCQLNIIHNDSGGTTYANVASIVPLGKGQQKISPSDYIRVQDRPPDEQGNNGHVGPETEVETDDDGLPF